MGEGDSMDRTLEQAILAMKKGAHLLKCRRRGKPKFCPFRLSTDERYLIWYSGKEEKQLSLSSVTKILSGYRTDNFQRQLPPDKEDQSFSLIHENGRSLDLICKDKAQADSWFIGLRAVISRRHRTRPLIGQRNRRGAQSCVNSPASYIRRKHNLGILADSAELSQARSLCGSPTQSLSERCFSDGLSFSSESFCLPESNLVQTQNVVDVSIPSTPYAEPQNLKNCGCNYDFSEFPKNASGRLIEPAYGSPQVGKNQILQDVLIWGEGVEGGNIGGVHHRMKADALLPRLLDSTVMLDVRSISLGRKHAALVTKQGEVFCWGEGSGGKLGHKVDIDVSFPKVVESLDGVAVKSVACGEYQTCALTCSGELYVWGGDKYILGGEDRTRSHWLPHKIFDLLVDISILSVACGEWHTAIVSTSGQLFTYGDGTFGVLGHGNTQSFYQPKEVESLKGLRVKSVACGSWHTAAIVDIILDRFKFNVIGGKLFTWGDGDKARLGHVDMETRLLPTCVAQLVDYDFVQVCCGRMLTAALTNTGKVYTMGSSVHGQLGNPQSKDKSITVVEGKLKEEFVKEIYGGSYHIAVLTSGGSVYTWGKGANGQLGLGNTEDRNAPTFVEALRERQVERIACGSNLTAAICLHKSVSITDQSACNGCRMPFGFTRKKHNCYNCGLLFCRACSSQKVINASLAPNKSKPYRVCDSCFNQLQKITCLDMVLKLHNFDSSQQFSLHCGEKAERGEATSPGGHLRTMRQSYTVGNHHDGMKSLKDLGEKPHRLETASSFVAGVPQWGQVPCPATFKSYFGKKSDYPVDSECHVSTHMNMEEDLPISNKMLVEEIQRLREEASCLQTRCEMGSQKIQEFQKAVAKTWLLAREEAAKRKAASEIIKALALRLHAMTEKVSAGKEAKEGVDVNLPPPYADAPIIPPNHSPLAVTVPKDRKVDGLSTSPTTLSNAPKTMDGRELCIENSMPVDNLYNSARDSRQNGTKMPRLEWVEQYEAGVYITLTILPSGQRGLKRVRFSRKRFAEKEAQRWWEENQVTVYQKYGIEGYIDSNQNQT